jgi:hypothetical protein
MIHTRNHTPAPMPSAVINLSTTQANGLADPASLVSQFLSLKEQLLRVA